MTRRVDFSLEYVTRVVCSVALALSVSACATTDEASVSPSTPAADALKTVTPPPAAVVLGEEADSGPALPKTEVFSGDDSGFAAAPAPRRRGASAQGDVNLDFAEAEVKDVIRTVLGDILKVPYAIDPQVQGKVTIKTSKPLRRDDVVAALETALKVNGAVIVLADNVYNVVPATEAQRRIDGFEVSGSARSRLPGYGIEIVPLKFVAAAEMQKILQPVAPAGGVLSVDSSRNLVFLAGTGQERASMLDTIRLFDVDYMKGMSYALVRPDHMEATVLAEELKRVFETTAGANASLLRFVPLTRLNTLLVVSPRSSYLGEVTKWVARLDIPQSGPGRRIYYYRMQNAKAEDVARSLAAIYGGSVNVDDAPPGGPSDPPVPPPPGGADSSPPPPASNGVGRIGSERGGPQIALDPSSNALIIQADATEYGALERFLKEIDVAPDQVMVEVTIAEVTLNDTLKYGVEWFFRNADQTYNFSKTGDVSSQFPGFSFTYTVPDIDVAVNALGAVTDIKVISAPKLITLDNKPATLQVGDQVPIVTQSATGVRDADDPTIVNSVQFRDTGIVLKVTPRVGKSGTVFVDVNQEVSSAIATTSSGIDSPTIQQRKIATTVAVQDGDAVALGGLIRDSRSYGDSGVPVLKDIPLLGKLFSSTTDTQDRTELLIFLRPRILRSPAAAREMTEQLRKGLSGLDVMLNESERRRNGGR
jgi:general secretion pathway protein D